MARSARPPRIVFLKTKLAVKYRGRTIFSSYTSSVKDAKVAIAEYLRCEKEKAGAL